MVLGFERIGDQVVDVAKNVSKDLSGSVNRVTEAIDTSYKGTVKGTGAIVDNQLDNLNVNYNRTLVALTDLLTFAGVSIVFLGGMIIIRYGDDIVKIINSLAKPIVEIITKVAENGGIAIKI